MKHYELPSGGYFLAVSLSHIIYLMYTNPMNKDKIHEHYENDGSFSELWTGQKWREYEKLKNQCNSSGFFLSLYFLITILDAILFPLIAYSDETGALLSRGGACLYPIVLVPAGVPRVLRRHESNKFTIGYIGGNGDINEILNILSRKKIFLK